MQALSDEQQIERLENKVDRVETNLERRIEHVETNLGQRIDHLGQRIDHVESKMENGLSEVRSESRADFRLLLGAQLTTLAAMILGFAGILLQHL